MQRAIGIVGIHTGIGKTVTSAVLVEALQADYWKPVQAGDLENSDTITVRNLVSNGKSKIHEEAFKLSQPMSPHKAAKIDGVKLDLKEIELPQTDNILFVETAGGVHSPMGDDFTMVDFVKHHQLPVILVTRNYLGSINHTLLCIEVLKSRGVEVKGIMVSGEEERDSETFIESYFNIPIIARVPELQDITKKNVLEAAETLKNKIRGVL